MNRKQIVTLQMIGIIILAAGLVILCIHLVTSGAFERETEVQTAEETKPVEEAKAEEAAAEEAAAEEEQPSGSSEEQTEVSEEQPEASEDQPEASEDPDGPRSYTFSFAGDCTIGSLIEWQGTEPRDFQSVVGTDYAYPLSHVHDIFSADDLTMVNLEGTFTTSYNAIQKPYRFRADPAYVQVLTEGSVEAVSASNNHAGDFQEEGVRQTLDTLTSVGVLYARAGTPLIHELDGGLKIGVVSYNTVENWEGEYAWRTAVQNDIQACKDAGCDLILGFMHWGTVEYLKEPEAWEVAFAHDMVSWGCDMIVGGHAHILQRMEYYNDVPIFYSMGNFCYGGHLNPDDKDSVIVQAEFTRDPGTGEVTRSGLSVIPCLVSSRTDTNDYCPTPCEEGSVDYQRILERLQWAG